ncbi:MAG: SGNH/GDSL hydrolase family protein [Clostridia bacterium]|nr:SGNH/GDSL hydrolase family protein [Clostridia bacterium]
MKLFRKSISVLLCIGILIFIGQHPILADDPITRMTFFGDSTTAHLALRGGIPKEHVWSGAGNTVLFETVNRTRCVHLAAENRDLTLADAVALKKPQILVITVGVSGGAGMLSRERFTAIYRELLLSVQKASPETKILVQSMLPLSDRSVKYYKRLTKEAVLEGNLWIRALCMEMRIPYIDSYSVLIDTNTGYLKKEFQNDEYMHLTAEAYRVILENIRAFTVDMGW